jgi:anti-sigma regulatory factor (Ser/Thr protein kinase)
MSPQTDTLRLVPGDDTVTLAMRWLQDIAGRETWPDRVRFGLMLSMDEALTNVLAYAFAPDASTGEAPAIELRCVRDGQHIHIEIADNGRPYDPTAWSPAPLAATLDDATPGGQGVRLMRHYLKDLRYRRDGGWNRLTLVARYG